MYENALFDGKGFMHWDSNKGFEINLIVNSNDYKNLKARGFGGPKIIKERERQNIYLYVDGFKVALIPSAYLGPRLSIEINKTLSIKSDRLIFFQNRREKNNSFWIGSGILRLTESNHIFPDIVSKEEKIRDNIIYKGETGNGISFQENKFSITGWLEDDEYFYFRYKLHKDFYSQMFALNFPCGLRDALSFLLGIDARRLQSNLLGRNSIVSELIKNRKCDELSTYESLKTFQLFQSNLLAELSLFFTKGYENRNKYRESYVSQCILNQLVEAEKQKNITTQELLTATILEASLRSLYDVPFTKDSTSNFSVSYYLKNRFIPEYADGKKWRKVRKTVWKSFERMRHRNAHPDWLFDDKDIYDDDNITNTFHDLRIMIKFYQQMILLMADINIRPSLPAKI